MSGLKLEVLVIAGDEFDSGAHRLKVLSAMESLPAAFRGIADDSDG